MATNPIKILRMELGLTQGALASIAGITEQVILKSEQGLYPTLPPTVLRALSKVTGISESNIEAQYEEWINSELKLVELPPATLKFDTPESFLLWKAELCTLNEVPNSVVAVCKLLKINPYVIQKYEAGRLKQTPLQLVERVAFIRGVF
jgi:transcriptional regulator with XRE-family HTH domain